MATAVEKLPDDPALLKALIRKERESFQKQLNTLIEALHLERHRRYGTRSEKAPGQGELFDEAEQDNDDIIVESDQDSVASVSYTHLTLPTKA